MFQRNDKVLVTLHGVTVEGTINGPRRWVQVGGHSPSKHQVVNTSVWNWGYEVRRPIVNPDGTLYMVRGQVAMGLGNMDERLLRAA
jgi:hypothetical protein